MKTDKNLLKLHYKAACNDYAYELMRQWELAVDDCWWVADEVGGIWCFMQGEQAINMQEIIYCIDNDVCFETYINYYDYLEKCEAAGLPRCNLMHFVENKNVYPLSTLTKLAAMRDELFKATLGIRDGKIY